MQEIHLSCRLQDQFPAPTLPCAPESRLQQTLQSSGFFGSPFGCIGWRKQAKLTYRTITGQT